MEVECPPGNVVGSVEQNINCYRPTLDINDQNGDVQYVIEGPSSCKTFCKGIIQMGIFKLPLKYQYLFKVVVENVAWYLAKENAVVSPETSFLTSMMPNLVTRLVTSASYGLDLWRGKEAWTIMIVLALISLMMLMSI